MPRLILQLGAGAQTAAVSQAALGVQGVDDAVEATQANAVIVNVDRLTAQRRRELASLPGVDGVFDDIQAIPQVADEDEVQDFLNRVRELRGESAPATFETKPTREGDVRTDGGARITPAPETDRITRLASGPIRSASDAVRWTGAADLHQQGIRGESIISVVIDTGACRSAIRDDRQLEGADLTGQDDPWQPVAGHGGMTTGIMAGDATTPGIDVGFLPESDVYPIKSTLAASELIQAQDLIAQLNADNPEKTVIVNNSWGFTQCTGLCSHPVTTAIDSTAGNVTQVFAAGNQASGPTGCGQACDGSTPGISGPNSLPSVITVAASGADGEPGALHPYSSRGGQGNVGCGERKPDLAAPIYGLVPYGCSSKNINNGGGTSGACPMVAGAVGLLADAQGGIGTTAASAGLRGTASQFLGTGYNGCSGAGNIQIADAVGAPRAPTEAGFGSSAIIGAGITAGLIGALIRRRSS